MAAGIEFLYDSELDIAGLYHAALRGLGAASDIALLSRNFVGASKGVLATNNPGRYKAGPGVEFIANGGQFIAKAPGFIALQGAEIRLYPLFHLNSLETRVIAVLPSRRHTTELLSVALLRNMIADLGVKTVIPDQVYERLMELYQGTGGATLVCEGREPVNGRAEVVTLTYELRTSIGQTDAKGRIDYRQKNYINNILKGDQVATWEPPVEAVAGLSVLGTSIPPRIESPKSWKLGKGIELRQGEGVAVAALDGVVHISDDLTIDITDQEVISGDVDLTVGNVEVKGSLTVKGNILPGFTVSTSGNLTVLGNIEESTVTAGGSIEVLGGIVGNETSRIECGGDLKANFIRNGILLVKGTVEVATSVMSSTINANGAVLIKTEKKGKVVGGIISGRRGVEVWTVGSATGANTKLIAGVDVDRDRDLRDLNNRMKDNKDNIQKLMKALGNEYFENPQEFFKRLPAVKVAQVRKVIEALKNSLQAKKFYAEEFARLEQASADDKRAAVLIYAESFPGTTIQICSRLLQLDRQITTPTRFILDPDTQEVGVTAIPSAKSTRRQ